MQAKAASLDDLGFEQLTQELALFLSGKQQQGFTYFSVQATQEGYQLMAQPEELGEVYVKASAIGTLEGASPSSINLVQATHQFFDKHTKPIADALYQSDKSHILMLNTTQRYARENTDLTHLKYSLFTALPQAIKAINKTGKVIQIHGFDAEKRATDEAKNADIILSNGTAFAYPYMQNIQTCFRDVGQTLVRIYGRDVFELGGVQNQVGKRLRDRSGLHFLHVEVSDKLRLHWLENGVPEALIQCVLQ